MRRYHPDFTHPAVIAGATLYFFVIHTELRGRFQSLSLKNLTPNDFLSESFRFVLILFHVMSNINLYGHILAQTRSFVNGDFGVTSEHSGKQHRCYEM